MRFREKRKERNFDKKIRYTVRKEVALRLDFNSSMSILFPSQYASSSLVLLQCNSTEFFIRWLVLHNVILSVVCVIGFVFQNLVFKCLACNAWTVDIHEISMVCTL